MSLEQLLPKQRQRMAFIREGNINYVSRLQMAYIIYINTSRNSLHFLSDNEAAQRAASSQIIADFRLIFAPIDPNFPCTGRLLIRFWN